ncbi:hypothetical protein [Nonomuraea sp. NPDC046570]|uniref:hypothetical protein n=1 Tax=Nonomuraea sp. NPDC046570 TaxID=3155255 RepID=UPI003407715F
MARIETRVRKDGRTKTYRVQWRLGGSRDGEWQSETFDQKALAVTFKLAVEACGHHWPERWIRGYGWAPLTPEPITEAQAEPILFDYVSSLSGIEERTRHDYQRDLRNHILQTFGDLDIRDGTALDRTLARTWVDLLQNGVRDPADPTRWRRRPLECLATSLVEPA